LHSRDFGWLGWPSGAAFATHCRIGLESATELPSEGRNFRFVHSWPEQRARLSLASAQDQVAVPAEDGAISLPLGNAPRTHIFNSAVERFEGVVRNEAFCMKLATAAGFSFLAGIEGQGLFLIAQKSGLEMLRSKTRVSALASRMRSAHYLGSEGIVFHRFENGGCKGILKL